LRIKLDENISRHLKSSIETFGHNVQTVEEENLLSEPDTKIAFVSKSENRMLFTLDIEFADLRKYPPGNHPGIVLFRPRNKSIPTVNQLILDFIRQINLDEITQCVVVVDSDRIRIRRPLTHN
jgi:predicted nuclease of predicted toxin-antitoxin system